jgi:hypothetical protein
VRRFEQELPESFTPHPLFREDSGLDLPVEGGVLRTSKETRNIGNSL